MIFKFQVNIQGDASEGLSPVSEEISIHVAHAEPNAEMEGFVTTMQNAIKEYYDGISDTSVVLIDSDADVEVCGESREIRNILKENHILDKAYEEYVEGFYSDMSEENPHAPNKQLWDDMTKISTLNRPLTDEEKEQLSNARHKFDLTPYSLWARGRYRQKYTFLQ